MAVHWISHHHYHIARDKVRAVQMNSLASDKLPLSTIARFDFE